MAVRRWWFRPALAVLCGLGASPACAHATAEVVEWGRMTGERATSALSDGGSALVPTVPMSHQRYLERTDVIEARLCRSFGLMLRIRPGPDEPEPGLIRVRILHPTLTGPDGTTSTVEDFATAVVSGETHAGFTFDHAWEMAPGRWTFVISLGGPEIARHTFTVTMPAAGAAASDCAQPVS